MPKERIYTELDRKDARTGSVGLGWGRNWSPRDNTGAPVQIATCAHLSADDGEERLEGQTVYLDREGINRLIRALRKARDQAYGHDE